MTTKYQRPSGAYAGGSGLANRTKYQDDANAVPKRAISSAKVDGDLNYVIDALNQIDEASGVRASLAERLNVALNDDGTLKASVAAAMDEFIVHTAPGSIARVDNSTFSLSGGDYRGIYTVNRRVKVTVAGVGLVGDVSACTYSGGVTTVSCVDLLDANGSLGVIASAPTQVAYGPLTPGARGNMVRKLDKVSFPASGATYDLTVDTTDLVVKCAGSVVARVTSAGVSGVAAGSVALAGLASDALAKLVPSGVVAPFAGTVAPTGWLMCYGQAVSRTTYANLFAAIGTTYGAGDGSTTFVVPDLRGRSIFGLDNIGGTDAGRLSVANTLGLGGGSQTKSGTTDPYTLTVADMPAHQHRSGIVDSGTAGAFGYGANHTGIVGAATSTTKGVLTESVGGGGAHSHTLTGLDVMPPYMLLNYMIKA